MFHQKRTSDSLPYSLSELTVKISCYDSSRYEGEILVNKFKQQLESCFPTINIKQEYIDYQRVELYLMSINNISTGEIKVLSQLCPNEVRLDLTY